MSSDLTWVLQSNAIGKRDLDLMTTVINESGFHVEALCVIPFSHQPADPVPNITGPCLVYGSSGLLKFAHQAGWKPAGWDGPQFEVEFVNERLGNLALNHDAILTVWSDALSVVQAKGWKKVFIRPNSETKDFPGQIFEVVELASWIGKLEHAQYFENNDNAVVVAPIKDIRREWRAFVVNGDLVSMCQYAVSGSYKPALEVPTELKEFLYKILGKFQPAPCFVADVAEVSIDEQWHLRVIEFNSINSAGFYLCDIKTLIKKMSAYALQNEAYRSS